MNNSDSQTIVQRFFKAIAILITEKRIRGFKTFADRYGIDRRNLRMLEKNNKSNVFQVAWLMYLSRDFGVSAEWLLLGKEPFYNVSLSENTHNTCTD